MDWHKRLTQARTVKNLRKTELAKLVGVSPATVTMWESGKTKKIEGTNLVRVCDLLGISPAWLLGEEDESDDAWFWQNYSHGADGKELWPLEVVRFIPDDAPQGYRVEPERELESRSLFALRMQWFQVNDLSPDFVSVMRVRSLDMEPAIAFGDIIVLDRWHRDIKDGAVYLLIYEGTILLRRLQRDSGEWWLTSDHEDQRRHARKLYRPEDVKIIGKVVLRQTERI
jgi:phage repressor protein C with HTH and peptisase S24 domain